MTARTRDLLWALAAWAAGLGWLYLLVSLSRTHPPLVAYALAAVPAALLAAGVGLGAWRWHRRRRRRLKEEEFRV